MKENRRMSTCNRLDLHTLGSQPVMPKNVPDHCVDPQATLHESAWGTKTLVTSSRTKLRQH